MSRNQHRVAERGREPGLLLERGSQQVALKDWGLEMVQALQPIAAQLDAAHATQDYSRAVADAVCALQDPQLLPSAQVLQAMTEQFGGSFRAFALAQSAKTKAQVLATPLTAQQQATFVQQSRDSVAAQKAIEAADTQPFDEYLRDYLAPQKLTPA